MTLITHIRKEKDLVIIASDSIIQRESRHDNTKETKITYQKPKPEQKKIRLINNDQCLAYFGNCNNHFILSNELRQENNAESLFDIYRKAINTMSYMIAEGFFTIAASIDESWLLMEKPVEKIRIEKASVIESTIQETFLAPYFFNPQLINSFETIDFNHLEGLRKLFLKQFQTIYDTKFN